MISNDIRCIEVSDVRRNRYSSIPDYSRSRSTRTTIPIRPGHAAYFSFELAIGERQYIIIAIAFVNLKIVRRKLCHIRGTDKVQILSSSRLEFSSANAKERSIAPHRWYIHASSTSGKRHCDISLCVSVFMSTNMPIMYNNMVQNFARCIAYIEVIKL